MIRIISTVGALVALFVLSGCGVTRVGAPVGVGGGLIVDHQTFGGHLSTGTTEFKMSSPEDYAVVGPVEATGSATGVLGLIGVGNTGYGLLLQRAKELGADDVINMYADTKYTSVLLGLYTRSTVMYYGTAIKYTRVQPLKVDVVRPETTGATRRSREE